MKFLRGKVWQIALAVCLLVVLLCITASAAEPGTASFKIGSNTYTINQDDEHALYFTTNESGVPTAITGEVDEMESTYNIKAVFPDDDGETEGVPTIYLRGAFLTQSITSVSNSATLARIVVEDDANFTVTIPVEDGDDKVVNARLGASISWSHSDLEICGPGKLYTTSNYGAAGRNITFKDADVEQVTTTAGFANFLGLTFDGGRYVFNSASNCLTSFWDSTSRSVLVTNDAYVEVVTENSALVFSAESTVTVESGHLRLISTGTSSTDGHGKTLRGKINFNFKGGTVEVSGAKNVVYSGSMPIDLSEYTSYQAVYAGVSNPTPEQLKPFTDTQFRPYHGNSYSWLYFKLEPKYTTTVSGGTASPAAGVANTEVTLTATPAANQNFLNWTVEGGPEGFDISDLADPSAETTTFTMPEGNVSVKANYETVATIQLGTLTTEQCTFTSTTPKYFTTDASTGEITPISAPADGTSYNIKLAFNGDVPTVYLKGAYIKVTGTTHAIQNVAGAGNIGIVTEVAETKIDTTNDIDSTIGLGTDDGRNDRYADSYISHADGSAVYLGVAGSVTFSGDGLLKTYDTTAEGKSINSAVNANVNFTNANVAVYHASTAWGSNAFTMHGVGTVKTTGGKVSIYTKYIVFYSTGSHIVVEDGADLSFISSNIVAYEMGTLTVNGGRMYAKADGTGSEAFRGADSITVNGGEMEVVCGKTVATAGISSLYEGSYAAMGASKATAEPYTAGSALEAKYFHIGKKATVNVTNGTAKVYQASGTQIDAIVGDTVTLTPNAATGEQVFIGWTFDEGSLTPAIANNTFKMPDGAVSVTANYGKEATINLLGTAYTFNEMTPRYFSTTDGAINAIPAPQDGTSYNIKLAFDDGVPTVFLKGATIVSNANATYPMQNGTGVDNFAITVEEDSTISSLGRGIYLYKSDLTINGPGKLTINSNTGGTIGYGAGGGISVQNEAVPAEGVQKVYTITIGADADVSITTPGTSTACIWNEPNSGKPCNVIIQDGGSLELIAEKFLSYPGFKPTLTDNSNWAAVAGTSKETATAYTTSTTLYQSHQYFKIARGYTVTVDGGTASVLSNNGRAFAGATVKLTAPAITGKQFVRWEAADGSAEVNIADATAMTTTFTMPEGNVSLVAVYKKVAEITIGGTAYTFSDNEPRYFTTDNGVLTEITEGDLENLYNVKLAYENDLPTVFLKNATITTTQTGIKNAANTPDFVIKTVAASTISQTDNVADSNGKYSAVNVTGQVTFKGSALLTLKGRENAFYGNSSAKIIFEGANVNLEKTSGSDWGEAAFSGSFSQVTVNGGTVNVKSAYMTIYGSSPTFTVQNNAVVGVECSSVFAWNTAHIVVDNGRLLINAKSTASYYLQGNTSGESSTIKVANGGELEIVNTGKILHIAPDLSNYQGEYYAVMGDDASTATKYNGTDALSGKYFRIGKKATVTVTDGTAKAFGESSTATEGTTQVLETMIGANVTLTAGTAPNGKEFFKWVDATSGETFTGVNAATGTFKLTGNVSVQAEFAYAATIKLLGTAYKFTEEVPLYFTTTDGAVTPIPAPQDGTSYNIKLAFVDGVPTVFLKGATITSKTNGVIPVENGTNVSHLVIHTEEESFLYGYGNAIYVYKADLTFEGNEKLTLVGNNIGTGSYGGAAAIFVRHYHKTNDPAEQQLMRMITVGADANVHIISNGTSTAGIWGDIGTTEATNNITVVGGSTLEIESASNIFYNGANLTFQDYADWAGVIGNSKEAATGYDGGVIDSNNRDSKYFKIAPGYQVSVTGGTATGVSSNNGRFLPGTAITLTPGAAPSATQAFYQWTTEDDIAIANNKFTMPASNVSVEATYQSKATIYFKSGTPFSVYEFTPTYLKSVADKAPTVGTEGDHDIELIYTDGIPTVYLKGAALTSTASGYCLRNGDDISNWMIVVEEDSSITAYGQGIYSNKADLTIRGPGKLTINNNTSGKVQYSGGSGIVFAAGNGDILTLAEDADVEIYTHSVVIGQDDKGNDVLAFAACIWIESGSQPVTIENGAKLELSSPQRVAYSSATLTIANDYTDHVAIYGDDLATAPLLTTTTLADRKFFKIAPGYDVTVTNGTANVTKAFKGMNVTVTPAAAEANMGFAYWTSADVLGAGKNYDSSYTFTMPDDKAVTLTANYGELAQVSLRNGLYDAVKGGKTHYYTVTNNVITENGNANNYNISFEWAVGTDTVPTVTLNNVTLLGTYERGAIMNGPHTNDLIVRVSGTNTLTQNQGGQAFRFSGNHLTVEGVLDEQTQEYGTLNLQSDGQVLYLAAPNATYHPGWDAWDSSVEHTVTFNNVNTNMAGPGTGVIRAESLYHLTFNGGTLNLTANAAGGNSAIYIDGAGNIVFNNTDVTVLAGHTGIRTGGDLTINGGTVSVGTAVAPTQAAFSVRYLTITDATVEAFASGYVYGQAGAAREYAPDLSGYTYEYAAVLAKTYDQFLANPEGYAYTAGSDTRGMGYFRVEPKEVKVQITWGAMSFTYDGAAWNVDTMSWEGTWTPVEGETDGLKANQIHVENVGTETVNVSFEFRQGDSFNHADVSGAFTNTSGAAVEGAYKLVRTAETDAFLNLNSAAVATDFGQNVELGVIVVTIDVLTPSQGSEA